MRSAARIESTIGTETTILWRQPADGTTCVLMEQIEHEWSLRVVRRRQVLASAVFDDVDDARAAAEDVRQALQAMAAYRPADHAMRTSASVSELRA